MRRGLVASVIAILAVGIGPLSASTFVAVSDAELVRQADSVVEGRVLSQKSSWDAAGRVIVTEAVVRVQSVLVGTAPRLVTVRNYGGTVGEYSVKAIGFPEFRDRERVILFLEDNQDGTSRVLGHQLGHFEVVERLDGVKVAVPRVEDGAQFLTDDGNVMPERQSIRLRDFKRGVRRLAREQQDDGGR